MRRSAPPRAASAAGAGHPARVSPRKSPAARPISEHQLQRQVAAYLDAALPDGCWWTSIDSAGRGPIDGRRMKLRGVKRGTADILIISDHTIPAETYWVELKSAKGALSPAQEQFRQAVKAAGHKWCICRSIEDVAEFLKWYGVKLRGEVM